MFSMANWLGAAKIETQWLTKWDNLPFVSLHLASRRCKAQFNELTGYTLACVRAQFLSVRASAGVFGWVLADLRGSQTQEVTTSVGHAAQVTAVRSYRYTQTTDTTQKWFIICQQEVVQMSFCELYRPNTLHFQSVETYTTSSKLLTFIVFGARLLCLHYFYADKG